MNRKRDRECGDQTDNNSGDTYLEHRELKTRNSGQHVGKASNISAHRFPLGQPSQDTQFV